MTLVEVLIEDGFDVRDSSSGRKVVNCMFHEGDHEASFTIYPTGTYFCFACEAWGDTFKYLVEHRHWSTKKAFDFMGEDYKQPKIEKAQVIKIKNTTHTWKFLYDVALSYHDFLLQTPGAVNYLYNRGLSIETINRYKIGYTDGRVLKLFHTWEMEFGTEIGIVNKGGYETLSHRITIPNITEDGFCDFMVGRTVTNEKPKYMGARMPKPIHGFYEVRNSPLIFLAEGQFDWLTLRQWGYPAAVTGGSHLTRIHKLLLQDKKIVIVPDLDPSGHGMDAARNMKDQLGDNAIILDYSSICDTTTEKVDVSSLAVQEGAQIRFMEVVRGQIPWLTSMSQRMLNKFFPSFPNTILLPSTPKPQV